MFHCPIFNFDFHLFLKNDLKKMYQKTCQNVYIYNNYWLIFFFWKSDGETLLWSLCWCQCNSFHHIVMDNEWLRLVWNFKNPTLGKLIWILFLLWKSIKYTFLLFVLIICIKKMPGVRSIAMKSIRTTIQLYSLCKEIGAGPAWKTGIRISLRGTASSADYI